MSVSLPVILGSSLGAVTFLIFLVIIIYLRISHKRARRTSESSSSDPSPQVALNFLNLHPSSSQRARCFSLEELNKATKNFSNINLIGEGKFGEVYKGLILDMIVAIKRRSCPPSDEFIDEVHKFSSIRHRNLVNLLGFCQESNMQMLVYEYIPNGSISSHLFGTGNTLNDKLEFKHRLSIAHRAAKGLAHLHSLNPPVIHMDFMTSNVLVDENFIPKVADVGILNFLRRDDVAGPSQRPTDNLFLDPGILDSSSFTEKSDVYSFGVFLLELVSGTEASTLHFVKSSQGITAWARDYEDSSEISNLIDRKMSRSFTEKGMRDFLRLTSRCLINLASQRPPMSIVVSELEQILEREMKSTMIMGEGSPILTLGSELFSS